jgi:hypothetical protein
MVETTMPVVCVQPPEGPVRLGSDGGSASRSWTVLARSQSDALRVLYAALGVARGSYFKDIDGSTPDGRMQCQSLSATARVPSNGRERGLYLVTAEYGVPGRDGSGEKALPEPVPGGKPAYNWSGSVEYGPADVDVDGAAIASSSGEPLAIQGPRMFGRLQVRWYPDRGRYMAFDRMLDWFGTVNSDLWAPKDPALTADTIQPGQALCLSLGKSMGEQDLLMMEAEFLIKAEGHQPKVLDVGRRILLTEKEFIDAQHEAELADLDKRTVSPFRAITDANGDPITDPVPLDGKGQVLAPGKEPVALTFKTHKTMRFADLGI